MCYLNRVVAEILLPRGIANHLSGSGSCSGILRTSQTKLETIQFTKEDRKRVKRLKSGRPPGFWISQRTDLFDENFQGLEAKKSLDLAQDYDKTGSSDVVACRSIVNLVQVKSREESREHPHESYYFLP